MLKPFYTGKYVANITHPYDVFTIGYNHQRNFITPSYIDCKEVTLNIKRPVRRFVEITSGTGMFGGTIYAVSVIDVDLDHQIILRHDLSKLTGETLTSARDYIKELGTME